MALDTPEFEAEMTERSAHLFGPLTLVSRRTVWPIISQTAEALSAERVALVAEAAHVVPPIGAQGLNMSLADIRTLLDLPEGARWTIPVRRPFFALRPRPARRYPCAGHGDRCAEPGVDGRGAGAARSAHACARRDLPRRPGAPGADADGLGARR
jgi:hypothetical protein